MTAEVARMGLFQYSRFCRIVGAHKLGNQAKEIGFVRGERVASGLRHGEASLEQ
ncbi:hypothetical protein IMCC9480_2481 [Oxalobacteraceae bacterium IMCC9480]|nr:hypothetical protein IMCC9480_2481 [Oxalobacteraceae bacterium IMCC9480]